MASKGSLFSLEDQFAFYGQYHVNKVNVAIHIICVPAIFTTALILSHAFGSPSFLAVSPPAFLVPLIGSHLIQFTPTFLVALSYAAYFIALDPVAGGIYAPLLAGMGHFSNVFVETNGEAMKIAGAVFVAAWIFQFIGHGKFEGRAPALFDSLFQSLVLAMFFVFLEVLFAVGYRADLHKRLQNRIGKGVLEYRKGLAEKRKKSS